MGRNSSSISSLRPIHTLCAFCGPSLPSSIFKILVTYNNITVIDAANSYAFNAFPQLIGLQGELASRLALSLAGQDFDHSYLVAVNDSFAFDNGTLTSNDAGDQSINFDSGLAAFRPSPVLL